MSQRNQIEFVDFYMLMVYTVCSRLSVIVLSGLMIIRTRW